MDAKEINSTTPPNYRNRTVTITGCGLADTAACSRTWKLGDIVTSTPKLVSSVNLNQYALSTPLGYADNSYKNFTASSTYKHRGMVFVGGNDGMLHAFRLGVLKPLSGRFDKGQFNNSSGNLATSSDDLGREEWSFIPKQTLPYLTYLKDPNYCHVFYVDKTPSIADVNIEKPAGCAAGTNYWDCIKPTDGSNWRTVLIGGTGLGGAAKWNGNSTFTAPTDSVKTPVKGTAASDGLGYSSYFALDVTDPTTPSFKWEFPGTTSALQQLAYSTTGPAIVRISAKVKDAGGNDTITPDNSKNGRWFAIFASGSTGPIDTVKREFKGQSDQQLRIFIVDMSTGALVRTIDKFADDSSLPAEAFAGSLSTSWIDSDRATPGNLGWYSDDAIYIGYTRKCTATDIGCTSGTWTRGGVIRLLTKESIDPDNWAASPLISDIGPVTTSVTKLQDRKNQNLWIYFGTGRYFFKNDATANQQVIYGVKEPCYTSPHNLMDGTCTTPVPSGLVNQSAEATTVVPTAPGWYINLDASTSAHGAERMITDPLASTAGAVFFTTFQPSNDVCKFGGDTYIWALNYATGGVPPARSMQGKALMQVSTGAFAEISLRDAFKTKKTGILATREDGRKLNTPISGVPPTSQGLSLITNPPAVKKILHVREK
jgi:type IV pilus assembly protein PilY1